MRICYFYNLKIHKCFSKDYVAHRGLRESGPQRRQRAFLSRRHSGALAYLTGTKHKGSWTLGWKASWQCLSPNPFPSQPWPNIAHRSLHLLSTYFLLSGSSLVPNIIALMYRWGPYSTERLSDLSKATQPETIAQVWLTPKLSQYGEVAICLQLSCPWMWKNPSRDQKWGTKETETWS